MKIFINAYLENNLGDDLFVDILLNRYSNHKFYALSSCYKKETNNIHVFSNEFLIKVIRKLKLKPLLANLNNLVVTIGGSMYMEKEGVKPNFSLGKNDYYILGTNFGPYKTVNYFNKAKEFFSKAKDVCFRESYSYNLFSELNNVRCASDIVFSLDTSSIEIKNEKKVIFSIISCKNKVGKEYTEDYEKTIMNLSQFFIDKGYKVCFMSFCKKEGDEEAIEAILDRCDDFLRRNITTYYYKGNRKEALEQIASSEIIVGGRFPANNLGMLFEKTVIPMMYSDKTKHVLEDMKFEGKVFDIRKLKDLDINKEIKEKDLKYKQNIEYQKQDAYRHFEILDKRLKKE